jgi:Hemerythrin HHE cation binding domain
MTMPNRTDSMISQTVGKAKAVKARMSGLVGVFQRLAEQHGEVASLLKRIKADGDKRTTLWPEVRIELLSHERGELNEVYPAIAVHPEGKPLVDQHAAEAAQLETMIERLDALASSTEAWGALFDKLVATVTAHASEEESQIFPAAQDLIGADRARDLEDIFLAAKERIASDLRTRH